MRAWPLAWLALLGAGATQAAGVCGVSTVGVAFGGYDSLRAATTDSTGTVSVDCSGTAGSGVSYSIALDTGSAGGFAPRYMTRSADRLAYGLYSDASRSVLWGDGTRGSVTVNDSYVLGATGVTRSYTVYGRIFARQRVPIGAYSDTIVVTLSF
jgi:spore coat protein U domain-containing protein, fimbrial subunit CupE1/2/3/6